MVEKNVRFLNWVVSTLIGALAARGVYAAETSFGTKEAHSRTAQVEFAAPVLLEEVLRTAERHSLIAVQIQHRFSIGQQQFVGFFPIPKNNSPEEIRAKWFDAYRAFLQDMADTANKVEVKATLGWSAQQTLGDISGQFKTALAKVKLAELKADGMIVKGDMLAIETLGRSSSLIENMDIAPVISSQSSLDAQYHDQRDVTSAASVVDWERWLPEGGSVETGPSSSGGRFVQHYMFWDDVSGFPSNSTYEHDFFLNNDPASMLGPGTYLTDRESPITRFPNVLYAASNLPTPYLDTRFEDPGYELAYTIGSANAELIKAYTWYWTYIRTENGTTNRDNAKLNGQIGHRSPSWCTSVWCSFGDLTVSIIPAWKIAVPSGMSWQK